MVPSTTLYVDCMVFKLSGVSLWALLNKQDHTTPVQIPLEDSNLFTSIFAFSIRPEHFTASIAKNVAYSSVIKACLDAKHKGLAQSMLQQGGFLDHTCNKPYFYPGKYRFSLHDHKTDK